MSGNFLSTGGAKKANVTSFKKGYDPRREKTLYKPGNYMGAESREEWTKRFPIKMADMKHKVMVRKHNARAIKTAKEIAEEAQRLAPLALKAAGKIMKSKTASDMAILKAADTILDRAYGKAAQTNINANLNADGKPSEIPAADLDRRITEALNRVESLTGREREAEQGEDGPSDLREYH